MARLHEYQGKAILAASGFKIPRGRAATSAARRCRSSEGIGLRSCGEDSSMGDRAGRYWRSRVREKRKGCGCARGADVGNEGRAFSVEAVLVEEKIDIDREFFLSFAIDDAARAPMIIFAGGGGTGIEERARQPGGFRAM